MSSLIEYFEALERLKQNKAIRVVAPYTINNDTVALEAGRKRGSIKKSRAIFSTLIIEINNARNTKSSVVSEDPIRKLKSQLAESKETSDRWRKMYEESIGREISLLRQLKDLQSELSIKTKKYIE